jgi:hypothetical protein
MRFLLPAVLADALLTDPAEAPEDARQRAHRVRNG